MGSWPILIWDIMERKFGAKLVPSWCKVGAKLVPSWCQVGAKFSFLLLHIYEKKSPKLGTNSAPTWHQLCTNFAPTRHQLGTNLAPTLHQLCTNFAPTLHQLCTNFAPTLHQLCTNFAPTLHQLCIKFSFRLSSTLAGLLITTYVFLFKLLFFFTPILLMEKSCINQGVLKCSLTEIKQPLSTPWVMQDFFINCITPNSSRQLFSTTPAHPPLCRTSCKKKRQTSTWLRFVFPWKVPTFDSVLLLLIFVLWHEFKKSQVKKPQVRVKDVSIERSQVKNQKK